MNLGSILFQLNDQEAKQHFSQNREQVFRNLFAQEGLKINSLALLKRDRNEFAAMTLESRRQFSHSVFS